MITATDEIAKEKWPLHSHSDMGTKEAKEITVAIQQNFDSLGLMLKSANERKVWKTLGYRDFGSYCNNEFGKSKSRAYQIIEEAEIAEALREEGGSDLKIPAQSYLRLLKDLPTTDKQIEAIKYAEDLAGESKKPTKIQMQLAVEKVSGTKPEQFKHTLNELGFTKGAEVITVRGINTGNRGFIRKLDKKGRLWVEMHTGNSSLIPYDVTSLRVLSATEKPSKAAFFGTTDIGDKVLIFSRSFENQIGEIAVRINEKMVVRLDNSKIIELPYTELEVIEVEVSELIIKNSWTEDCNWQDYNLDWRYDNRTNVISTLYRGESLALYVTAKSKQKQKSPSDWLTYQVRYTFSVIGENLSTPEDFKFQLIGQIIRLPSDEARREYAQELIADMSEMTFASSALEAENQDCNLEEITRLKNSQQQLLDRIAELNKQVEQEKKDRADLQGRLEEAEQVISQLVKSQTSVIDVAVVYDLNVEPVDGVNNVDSDALQQAISRQREQLAESLAQTKETLDALLDKAVGTTLDTVVDATLNTELKAKITQQRKKINEAIARDTKKLASATRKEIKQKLNKELDRSYSQLLDLDIFEKIAIGQTVEKKRYPGIYGKVINLDFSPGGMPQVWVRWHERDSVDSNSVCILNFAPDIQSEAEQWWRCS